jgi:hypothetical protein
MLFSESHNLGARALRETVRLVRRDIKEDDYGVQGAGEDVCLGPFPASVQMLSGMVKMNHYQTAEIEAYEVRLRYVPGRFEKIVWRDAELSVDSIEDVGMRGRWLRVYCSRRDKV